MSSKATEYVLGILRGELALLQEASKQAETIAETQEYHQKANYVAHAMMLLTQVADSRANHRHISVARATGPYTADGERIAPITHLHIQVEIRSPKADGSPAPETLRGFDDQNRPRMFEKDAQHVCDALSALPQEVLNIVRGHLNVAKVRARLELNPADIGSALLTAGIAEERAICGDANGAHKCVREPGHGQPHRSIRNVTWPR